MKRKVKPSTSLAVESPTELRTVDPTLKEANALIAHIAGQIEEERRLGGIFISSSKICSANSDVKEEAPYKKAINRAIYYTGMQKTALLIHRNYLSAHQTQPIDYRLEDVNETFEYQVTIRDIIFKLFYDGMYPTVKLIFKRLSQLEGLPIYWSTVMLRRYLKNNGFLIKKAEGQIPEYVIEKPELTFERFRYLEKIKNFRCAFRPIFYIDESFFDISGRYLRKYLELDVYNKLYENEQKGFVTFAISKDGIYALSFEEDFETWLIDELIPVLPASSVVVYNNPEHFAKMLPRKPTYSNLKSEIQAFLDKEDIPYHSDMTKSELMELVDAIPVLRQKCKAIELLNQAGHEFLVLPRSMYTQMYSTKLLYKRIKGHFNIKSSYSSLSECHRFLEGVMKVMGVKCESSYEMTRSLEFEMFNKERLIDDRIEYIQTDPNFKPKKDSDNPDDAHYVMLSD